MEATAHVLSEHQWRPHSASAHVELAHSDWAPAAPAPPPGACSLSDRDRRILKFERHWWRYAGAKEQAIRAEFALSTTRYYQILNVLIDSPEALVAEPMLVRRLRRLRAQRRLARASRSDMPERGAAAMDGEGMKGDPAS